MKDLARQTEQIKESVRRLYDAKKWLEETKQNYDKVREKEEISISNYMFSNYPSGTNSFEILLDTAKYCFAPIKLRVTKVRTNTFVWDIKKLKKQLQKKHFRKVVDKTYTINDYEGLVEYLKQCGVEPKKFSKFINVESNVNESAIDELLNVGELKQKDIYGCYVLKVGKPYIRLTELKK